MPAGAAFTPGGIPGGGDGFALLVGLPQGKVAGVALAAGVGIRSILHIVNLLAGQGTVVLPGAHVEVDVAAAVGRRVGVTTVDKALDEGEHLGNVPGCARLVGGRCDVEGGVSGPKDPLKAVGQGPPFLGRVLPGVTWLERGSRVHQNLVVDVGDVTNRGDLVTAVGQPAGELVKDQARAHVPDVRSPLHGGTTVVDPGLAGVNRGEVTDACCC